MHYGIYSVHVRVGEDFTAIAILIQDVNTRVQE